MTIKLKLADEALIQKKLRRGGFKSAEEIVHRDLVSWAASETGPLHPQQERKPLSEFLRESPLAGSELNLERDKDPGRAVEL